MVDFRRPRAHMYLVANILPCSYSFDIYALNLDTCVKSVYVRVASIYQITGHNVVATCLLYFIATCLLYFIATSTRFLNKLFNSSLSRYSESDF